MSKANREVRWNHIAANLPAPATGNYHPIRYQILHRCAASVIEAQQFGLNHAAFLVLGFKAPESSYKDFKNFSAVLGIIPERGRFCKRERPVGDISLSVDWVDCPLATDVEIAATAG
jgi:hypothetical protein